MERNYNPAKHTLNKTKAIVPACRYNGGDFEKWQKEAREKLTNLLGLPFEKCDDLFEIEYEEQHEAYKEIRFSFQSEEGYFVPGHFLIPNGATGKLPTAICLQGHSKGMHISLGRVKYEGDAETISGGDRDLARRMVNKGFCALVIEQRGMGECGGTPKGPACQLHTMANLLIGRTTIGERVWDTSRAIDILEKHFADVVDMNRLICMGNSGGGTTTFYTACLDERIKAAIPSCAYASFDGSISAILHCTCNFVPHMREYFDMGDMGGLIAPRTLIVVSGTYDEDFPLEAAKNAFALTQELYSHTNGICRQVIGPEGHRFYFDLTWNCYKELFPNEGEINE